jgi:hypothetical protein
MKVIESYQQDDFREFKLEDTRFYIKFGYMPNGEWRIQIARGNVVVFTHESPGFYKNKKKGRAFGAPKKGWIYLNAKLWK